MDPQCVWLGLEGPWSLYQLRYPRTVFVFASIQDMYSCIKHIFASNLLNNGNGNLLNSIQENKDNNVLKRSLAYNNDDCHRRKSRFLSSGGGDSSGSSYHSCDDDDNSKLGLLSGVIASQEA